MKLKEWLREHHVEHQEFAEDLGVVPNTICRLIKRGTTKLYMALAIEYMTGGEVKVEDILEQE